MFNPFSKENTLKLNKTLSVRNPSNLDQLDFSRNYRIGRSLSFQIGSSLLNWNQDKNLREISLNLNPDEMIRGWNLDPIGMNPGKLQSAMSSDLNHNLESQTNFYPRLKRRRRAELTRNLPKNNPKSCQWLKKKKRRLNHHQTMISKRHLSFSSLSSISHA